MKPTLKTLVHKLDRLLSEYVRRSAADAGGTVTCVTCNRNFFWKDVDCGHYIKRQHMAARFNPMNVAPQCRKCNRFAGGMMDAFALYLVKRYGIQILDELAELKHQTKKWTRDELESLIVLYKTRLKGLQSPT